jgi:hypothetical protein
MCYRPEQMTDKTIRRSGAISMLMTTERRPAGNARLRIFYPIYRRKKNGSKAAWRTMLAAARFRARTFGRTMD